MLTLDWGNVTYCGDRVEEWLSNNAEAHVLGLAEMRLPEDRLKCLRQRMVRAKWRMYTTPATLTGEGTLDASGGLAAADACPPQRLRGGPPNTS